MRSELPQFDESVVRGSNMGKKGVTQGNVTYVWRVYYSPVKNKEGYRDPVYRETKPGSWVLVQ